MKASNAFKEAIKEYLDKRAAEDELFAVTYAKTNKNLDECCNYVMQCANKGGAGGYSDAEVYGWAVHYYDEDDIKNVDAPNMRVVVNKSIELTEEEKQAARDKAMEREIEEQRKTLKLEHKVQLTAEDIAEVKKQAMDKAVDAAKEKLMAKKKPKPAPKVAEADPGDQKPTDTLSLF